VAAVATKAGVGVEQLISVDPVFTAPDDTGPAPAASSAAATTHPAAGTATPPPQNISGELEYLTNELLIVPAGTLIGK
jgi:hypothetical protein